MLWRMWVYILIGLVLVLVALYPFQGWITYFVHQRKRERHFGVTTSREKPTPCVWRDDRVTIS